jgi:hypothetical protein
MNLSSPFSKASTMSLKALLFVLPLGCQVFGSAAFPKERTDAEKYVLEQVKNGDDAKFQDRTQKELPAAFVVELLTNPDKHLEINRHGITISSALITGDVDLKNQEIRNDVTFAGCIFEGGFDASQSHFFSTLDLTGSTFNWGVDFENAVIDSDFVIDSCHFYGTDNSSPFFKSVRIGRDWSMQRALNQGAAQFLGSVNFTQSVVDGKLLAAEVTFQSGAEFDNMTVKGECILRNANFAGGEVNFGDTHFNNLFLNGANFKNTTLTDFTRMQVESIFLDDVGYPTTGSVKLEGMTFRSMSPASWDGLQDLRSHSAYDLEFYTSLETLFRSHGRTDQADRVFIDIQRSNRRAKCSSLLHECGGVQGRVRWFISLLEDGLTGYGRSLENLLLWSIGFIFLGTVVFRRTAMKRSEGNERDKLGKRSSLRYWRLRRWILGLIGGFWYSLDLFLPIIELGEKEKWSPRDNRRCAVFYKRVHTIIGHLFVPIGLAAWTGIIK